MPDAATNLLDTTTGLLAPLLNALDSLQFAGRHLHPPVIPTLAEHLAPLLPPLIDATAEFTKVQWPEHLSDFAERLTTAAADTRLSLEGIVAAAEEADPAFPAYRALRKATRARAGLYPLASILPPISRFFVSPEVRADEALAARLAPTALGADGAETGVMHLQNEPDQRGGCSVYVPEYYAGEPLPLVVALHGGSGHGADFLWSWVTAARSAGAIVLAPTSQGSTWSLGDPDVDHVHLQRLVARVAENWAIDTDRQLLTGMSDGGTFTLLSGLQADSFATHLAPISGTFHPFLMELAEPGRIKELPVFLVHGALDWMFPVDSARLAAQTLGGAGVDLHYEELADLSHTYPVEQSYRILRWLQTGTVPPSAADAESPA